MFVFFVVVVSLVFNVCLCHSPFICHKRQMLQQKHSAAVKFHISHVVLHCSNCLEGTLFMFECNSERVNELIFFSLSVRSIRCCNFIDDLYTDYFAVYLFFFRHRCVNIIWSQQQVSIM